MALRYFRRFISVVFLGTSCLLLLTWIDFDTESFPMGGPRISLPGPRSRNHVYQHSSTTASKNVNTSSDLLRITTTLAQQLQRTHIPCNATVTNIAYIRTHKTGSTVFCHILNRFGLIQNLSFVLAHKVNYGREIMINLTSFLDPKKKELKLLKPLNWSLGKNVTADDDAFSPMRYNMFALHIVYNRTALERVMIPGTRYITSLRNPVKQFESQFAYFRFEYALPKNISRGKRPQIEAYLEEWFRRPEYYSGNFEDMIKKHRVMRPDPVIFTRNSQMSELGFNTSSHQDDEREVSRFISKLDRELDFVAITDYYDESLVVMKKLFCWSFDDLLYVVENGRNGGARSTSSFPEGLRNTIERWNWADGQLFDHFNRSLWAKIEDYGDEFEADLTEFRRRLKEMKRKCTDDMETSRADCRLVQLSENRVMDEVRQRQHL